jgi:hypothetical protein
MALNVAFFETLRELGWIEGENVVFSRRYPENRLERLPELAYAPGPAHADGVGDGMRG